MLVLLYAFGTDLSTGKRKSCEKITASCLFTVVAACAISVTFSVFLRRAVTVVGAAYACFAAFFGFDNIPSRKTDYSKNNSYNNNVIHKFLLKLFYTFLFGFIQRVAIIIAKIKTATSPPKKPEPKVPVVIRVPI